MTASAEFEAFHKEHHPIIDEYLEDFFNDLREEKDARRKRKSIDRSREFVLRGGKRLRPISVLLGHGAVTGEEPDDELYDLSLSVEIYHNGTLMQDDFMDQDDTRRGGPSLHRMVLDHYNEVLPAPSITTRAMRRIQGFLTPGIGSMNRRESGAFGNATTGGNHMDNRAHDIIHGSTLPADTQNNLLKLLTDSGTDVNYGQEFDLDLEMVELRDVAREQGARSPSYGERFRDAIHQTSASLEERASGRLADSLSRLTAATDTTNELYNQIMDDHDSLTDAYITMIDEKTVDLYVASIDIGAVIGGATEKQRTYLKDAMRDIGRAFQIQDDYLEIEESVEQTGKEPTDIINGKLTLASISTYESLNTVVDVLGGAADRFDTGRLVSDHGDQLTGIVESSSYQDAVSSVDAFLDRGEDAVHTVLDQGIDLTAYADDDVLDYLDPALLRRNREAVRDHRETFLNNYGNLSRLRPETSFRSVTEIIAEYSYGKEMAEELLESAKDTLDTAQRDVALDPDYTERLKGLADYMLERSH